ncbi:MAG: class I SAM-dependent methyltransferase, partial [Bdellovibrionales bacterium]|nr:class I SAM-dependent methyltransferase [Bdellovibrionales bacterium]
MKPSQDAHLDNDVFACPASGEPLKDAGHQLVGASSTYPKVSDIPWLFPDPKHVLANWRERADRLLQEYASEITDLKETIKESSSTLTKQRLENIRTLKIQQLEMLKRILEPMKPGTKLSLPKKSAFGYRLPFSQGLLGYFPNIARDWGKGAEHADLENQTLFDTTFQALKAADSTIDAVGTSKRILVLGSGASRLAYDLAIRLPNSTVVAFDLNPVLLLAAKSINDGEKLKAVTFSASPRDRMNPGQSIELVAPKGNASNLKFVFGDVYALPFQVETFDVCITPWLVDILPRRFSELANSIRRVLRPKGHWINCGAWFFNFQNEADNISLKEAEEIGLALGWSPLSSSLVETPYLQSPVDNHRRFETMTVFTWQKIEGDSTKQVATDAPTIDDRIDWIRDTNLP